MVYRKLLKGTRTLRCYDPYVDIVIYMSSSSKMLIKFKEEMLRTFEMPDLGLLRYFLGLEVKQKPGSLFVSQHKYAEDLLKKTGMLHSKAISTPMNSNEKLYMKDNSGNADSSRYRRIMGSLSYLTHTRQTLCTPLGWFLGSCKRLHHITWALLNKYYTIYQEQ
ncbi:uncharacterized mitochondrial protein AtMg00810-like [Dioscorea cayenensis subsp. rotundata]|uniref:Uncharacterized mitochondrial protein AtMg00810-like n=1 Tax=Dioscorea cayennensis subsp. rotundata TaxID=55577 RepID=A0AB40AZQ8_DIOCR|nr:uncharacterized mitochondrial protein AtMg00810-like [Dioscorea cayenensis subsp. rotundata]